MRVAFAWLPGLIGKAPNEAVNCVSIAALQTHVCAPRPSVSHSLRFASPSASRQSCCTGWLACSPCLDESIAQNQDQTRLARELNRFGEQFRQDVHSAATADELREQPDEAEGVVLRLRYAHDRRVAYEQTAGGELVRTQYSGDKQTHRDAFDLGAVTFAVRVADDQPQLLSLAIQRRSDNDVIGGVRNRQVMAMIGRDWKTFAPPAAKEPQSQ